MKPIRRGPVGAGRTRGPGPADALVVSVGTANESVGETFREIEIDTNLRTFEKGEFKTFPSQPKRARKITTMELKMF